MPQPIDDGIQPLAQTGWSVASNLGVVAGGAEASVSAGAAIDVAGIRDHVAREGDLPDAGALGWLHIDQQTGPMSAAGDPSAGRHVAGIR